MVPANFRKQAVDLFPKVQGIFGDIPIQRRSYWFNHVVNTGLYTEELRDELYLQVIKQLINHPNRTCELQGWLLLLYFCQTFMPSKDLYPYLLYFLYQKAYSTETVDPKAQQDEKMNEIIDIARQACDEVTNLCRIYDDKQRKVVRSIDNSFNIDIMVLFMDNSRKRATIEKDTTFGDLTEDLCSRLHIESSQWAVMLLLEIKDVNARMAMNLLKILDFPYIPGLIANSVLTTFDGFPQFRVMSDSARVWDVWDSKNSTFPTFILRRKMISPIETIYPHPNHVHLTYKQILWEFVRYPFPEYRYVIANIIARILISEKWSPPMLNTNRQSKINAITYEQLVQLDCFPLMYRTSDIKEQKQWELEVQTAYEALNPDEYQLLAINNTLNEMQQLKLFGAISWLVVEPHVQGFELLLSQSQLNAMYKGYSVTVKPYIMHSLLQKIRDENTDDPSNKMIQPVIISENDIKQILINQKLANSKPESDKTKPIRKLFKKENKLFNEMNLITEKDENLEFNSENLNSWPLWMCYNTQGLYFLPSVSLSSTNNVNVPILHIFPHQIFACEVLWVYHKSAKAWLYGGLLFCLNMSQSIEEPQWTLIPIVPLSSSVITIVYALQAYLPSLHFYGHKTQ